MIEKSPRRNRLSTWFNLEGGLFRVIRKGSLRTVLTKVGF